MRGTGVVTAASLMLLCAGAVAAEPGTPIPFTDNGAPLFAYMPGPAPSRSYVVELRTPSGLNVLRDQVADHIHHHGLMMSFMVDKVDFWAETPECGKQIAQSLKKTAAGISERLVWTGTDGAARLLESRAVTAAPDAESGCTLLRWRSEFSLPPGREKAELTGSHYHGLGMRFIAAMDGQGPFFNASGVPGEIVRGEERNVPADWCAYTAKAEGKPVTVAMFAHPKNARHPAVWFTMPVGFAYMSATLNLHKEPLVLEGGEPLLLDYAVALWDGTKTADDIEKAYRRWLADSPR